MHHYNKPQHKQAPLFHSAPTPAQQPARARPDLFTDPARRLELAILRAIGLLFALPLVANGVLTLMLWRQWRHGTAHHAALDAAGNLHMLGQGGFALALGLLMLAPFAACRRHAIAWAGVFAGLSALVFLVSLL